MCRVPDDFIEYKTNKKMLRITNGVHFQEIVSYSIRILKYLNKYYDTMKINQFELNKILKEDTKIEEIFTRPIKKMKNMNVL
jgi:2-hydroxy-3-keto-5-methylthiopentenyl-1-phosphate phosphatase